MMETFMRVLLIVAEVRAGLLLLALLCCGEASAQTATSACTVAKCIANQTTNRTEPRTGKNYTVEQARRWCPANLAKSTACN